MHHVESYSEVPMQFSPYKAKKAHVTIIQPSFLMKAFTPSPTPLFLLELEGLRKQVKTLEQRLIRTQKMLEEKEVMVLGLTLDLEHAIGQFQRLKGVSHP